MHTIIRKKLLTFTFRTLCFYAQKSNNQSKTTEPYHLKFHNFMKHSKKYYSRKAFLSL